MPSAQRLQDFGASYVQLCPEWRCIIRTTNGPVHVCDKGPHARFGKSWSLFPSTRFQTVRRLPFCHSFVSRKAVIPKQVNFVPHLFRHLNAQCPSLPLPPAPLPLFNLFEGPWKHNPRARPDRRKSVKARQAVLLMPPAAGRRPPHVPISPRGP